MRDIDAQTEKKTRKYLFMEIFPRLHQVEADRELLQFDEPNIYKNLHLNSDVVQFSCHVQLRGR